MRRRTILFTALGLGLAACGADTDRVPGVDFEEKVIRVGELMDTSGPVSVIGRQWALGKRIAFAEVNDPESELSLPDGWTVRAVERDHGYNPQRSVQMFNEIRDDVLFIGTSFGTPNTMPLRPMLERHRIMAFPASLSRQLQAFPFTPGLGPSYYLEVLRALDFIVADAGAPSGVRLGIVYQQDDYGQDGLDAVNYGAPRLGIEVVARETYAPGQGDFTALVSSLRRAGATHVVLSTVPGATAPILGTAAQLGYEPMWLGASASWVDRFFDPDVVPPSAFQKYYLVSGLSYWGEDTPLFQRLHAAFEKHAPDARPDSYILSAYFTGMVQIEALRRMIESGTISRDGFIRALRSMNDFDAFGSLPEPMDFSRTPFELGRQTRVLMPNFVDRGWTVVSDFAVPSVPHD